MFFLTVNIDLKHIVCIIDTFKKSSRHMTLQSVDLNVSNLRSNNFQCQQIK